MRAGYERRPLSSLARGPRSRSLRPTTADRSGNGSVSITAVSGIFCLFFLLPCVHCVSSISIYIYIPSQIPRTPPHTSVTVDHSHSFNLQTNDGRSSPSYECHRRRASEATVATTTTRHVACRLRLRPSSTCMLGSATPRSIRSCLRSIACCCLGAALGFGSVGATLSSAAHTAQGGHRSRLPC